MYNSKNIIIVVHVQIFMGLLIS